MIKKRPHILSLAFVFIIGIQLLYVPFKAFAEDFVFETDTIRYVINSDGLNKSLCEKSTGKDWLAIKSTPFANVTKSGKTYPVTEVSREGNSLIAKFGETGIIACYQILSHKTHITFELKSLKGGEPDSIELCNFQTTGFPNTGRIITAQWNKHITICLMALSERVNSQVKRNNTLLSTVYPQFGMVGEKAALITVPTSTFLDVVQEIEKSYHLPSPTINGKWAKLSPDVRTNYLFIDVSEETVDQVIAYAKLGAFKYVLMPWSCWASSLGSYPINRKNFPQGEESLKETIDKFHAADLKVGMHMMTSLVSKKDPLVRPKPDPRLLKDASTTLAYDIDTVIKSIVATDSINAFSENQSHVPAVLRPCIDIQIDDEIIRCNDPVTSISHSFSECRRGSYGTLKKPHKAGVSIRRLAQGVGSYLADLKTSLKDQIADRVAEIVNQCGFDMIYFDGSGKNKANEPVWYYMGQQQIAIWNRLKRDVLLQGPGINHWLWHVITRKTCNDHAAIAVRTYMDYHKLKSLQLYRNSFMPAELGWCGILDGGLDHPATTLYDMMHYGVRMIAFDAPISIQTTLKKLKNNDQSDRILKLLKQIDELRLSGKISKSQQEQLKTGSWTLFDASGNVVLEPVKPEDIQHTTIRCQMESESHNENESLSDSDIPGISDGKDILLFQGEKVLEHLQPREFRPGSLIYSVYFTGELATEANCRNPSDSAKIVTPIAFQCLQKHHALSVTISVKGSQDDVQPPYPVLNIQLEDNRMQFRDHYIDLDFTGEKTIIIPHTNVERLLLEFKKKPEYNIKTAIRYFDYGKVAAMNIRWMRRPKNPSMVYSLHTVKAVCNSEIIKKTPVIYLKKN